MAAKDKGSGKKAKKDILRSAGAFPEAILNFLPSILFKPFNFPLHSQEVRTKISPGSTTGHLMDRPPFAVGSNRQYRRFISMLATTEPLSAGINAIRYNPYARHKKERREPCGRSGFCSAC